MSSSFLDAASARDREASMPPFDPDEALSYLRSHGVEIETHEERLAKLPLQPVPGSPMAIRAAAAGNGGLMFTYVYIPADPDVPVQPLQAPSMTGQDILQVVLKPKFASDESLNQETVTRETTHNLKNMVVGGGGDGMELKAPTADALQSLAVGGAVERWPLMQHANEAKSTRTSVYLYIDEIGALRARPRNKRAEALADAVGLAGANIHGDAYVGRTTNLLGGNETNADFPIEHLDHGSSWVHEARQDHVTKTWDQRQDESELDDKDSNGGEYKWSQTDDDVEVRVLKGIPSGLGSSVIKKRVKVSYGKIGDALMVTFDGASVLSLPKLFDRVTSDECSWSVVDGNVLVVTMEKYNSGKRWSQLVQLGN